MGYDHQPAQVEQSPRSKQRQATETEYVAQNDPNWPGLKARYENDGSNLDTYQAEMLAYAFPSENEDQKQASEVIKQKIEQVKNEVLTDLDLTTQPEESIRALQTLAEAELRRLFKNETNSPEGRRNNQEKFQIASDWVNNWTDLLKQSIADEDVEDFSTTDAADLMLSNIYTLAYQDRVATENMLGDHGLRHLLQHNISVMTETLLALRDQGAQVRAIDLLMGHQIMIDHDTGYAMSPVRDEINKGNFAADRGHNVLAAKAVRQRAEKPDDSLVKLFGEDRIDVIHQGIVTHDSSDISFSTNTKSEDPNQAERVKIDNLLSAIRLADNTHAFETKLPELLYGFPDTLKTMRLLKISGEVGDAETSQELKDQLKSQITANTSLAEDDKQALLNAADSLAPIAYKFNISRICGNNPEVTFDEAGVANITVTESQIHQEAVGLYGQGAYDQLAKFIQDLMGISKQKVFEQFAQGITEFSGEKIKIVVKIGEQQKATEKTDYQQRIEDLISDDRLSGLAMTDNILSTTQALLETNIKNASSEDEKAELEAELENLKQLRNEGLTKYLDGE